jgi:hypothetical protein
MEVGAMSVFAVNQFVLRAFRGVCVMNDAGSSLWETLLDGACHGSAELTNAQVAAGRTWLTESLVAASVLHREAESGEEAVAAAQEHKELAELGSVFGLRRPPPLRALSARKAIFSAL